MPRHAATAIVNKLQSWLSSLYDDFGDNVPHPDMALEIAAVAEEAIGARLTKYIGSCTNGYAVLTSDGAVAKFTIDADEVALWSQLIGFNHNNIAQCYGAWRLKSRTHGDTHLHLIHVEYVPLPLDDKLAAALQKSTTAAAADIDKQLSGGLPVSARNNLLANIRAMRQFTREEPRLLGIMDALIELADQGAFVLDLQPDNFRLDKYGKVPKIIDPSTPKG